MYNIAVTIIHSYQTHLRATLRDKEVFQKSFQKKSSWLRTSQELRRNERHYTFLVIDPFCLSSILYYIYVVPSPDGVADYYVNYDVVWSSFLILIALFFLWTFVLCIIELQLIQKFSKRYRQTANNIVSSTDVVEDEDVLNESLRITQEIKMMDTNNDPERNEDDILIAYRLSKVFKNWKREKFEAVKDVSFGVSKNECFGLLGPNGAGKSVTIGMLIGTIHPTSGKAFIDGSDLSDFSKDAYRHLGYCPQFDTLYEYLTIIEHLQLVCCIKGVPNPTMRIQSAINAIDLIGQENKLVKHLSGGTKRKLSFCLSIIASPQLNVLDEPSAGMDPKARKFLWDIIRINNAEKASLLTTHIMEEADTLCTRIGIISHGKLKVLGTSSHLKSKFGKGYRLEIKSNESKERIEEFLFNSFEKYNELQSFEENHVYQVPLPKKIGHAFNLLMKAQQDGLFKEFTFGQVTLEQVFTLIIDEENKVHESKQKLRRSIHGAE